MRCVIVTTEGEELAEGFGNTEARAEADAWEQVGELQREIADTVGYNVEFYKE